MNCKQGDLAVILWSGAGNEGKVVRCLEFVGQEFWDGGLVGTWRIDRPLVGANFVCDSFIADDQLRPIRPDSEPTSFESHRELESA
jgi:hypothetical protein